MHCSNYWRIQAATRPGMAWDCNNLSDFEAQEGVLILILGIWGVVVCPSCLEGVGANSVYVGGKWRVRGYRSKVLRDGKVTGKR